MYPGTHSELLDCIMIAGPGGMLRGRGRVAHVLRPVSHTSGRRLASYGNIRGTYILFRIALEWYLGVEPDRLQQLYWELWTDKYR